MLARAGRPFLAVWLALLAMLVPLAARADPTFPQLTGRVVDAANIIPPDEEVRLDQKLAGLEAQSHRQLVVATLPDLQGYDIADYGYQLGRAWGIGQKQENNGALLIVAPNERKVRIEVGYGLEGTLTDAMSSLIIQQNIVPKFKAGDMPGGIEAGTDAIIHLLTLPPEEAAKVTQAAAQQAQSSGGADPGMVIFVIFVVIFFVIPMLNRAFGGRRYRGGSGLGPLIVYDALSHGSRGWGGGGWGGGGGGGFSGGGGSFGGGGASGSW